MAAITAISLTAEIGDLARFSHPRKLMGYLGLVPSEHSSGERTSRGSIAKTGNAHARRLLTEAAWNYRFKARIGREALARQEALSSAIRTTAWKAQLTHEVAAAAKCLQLLPPHLLPRHQRHLAQLRPIVADVGDLVCDDEVVLGVEGRSARCSPPALFP